jgi:hypothetical protein
VSASANSSCIGPCSSMVVLYPSPTAPVGSHREKPLLVRKLAVLVQGNPETGAGAGHTAICRPGA